MRVSNFIANQLIINIKNDQVEQFWHVLVWRMSAVFKKISYWGKHYSNDPTRSLEMAAPVIGMAIAHYQCFSKRKTEKLKRF